MEDPLLMDRACADLLKCLRRSGLDIERIDRVVGPAMGAITVAHDLARHISRKRLRPCMCAYTEKFTTADQANNMFFKRTKLRPGESILLVEDVLTTGNSLELAAAAVTLQQGIVGPLVGVLVNRSGLEQLNDRKIIALIDHPMPMWKPEDCPLCKQGSDAIRPKGTENWARLNVDY